MIMDMLTTVFRMIMRTSYDCDKTDLDYDMRSEVQQ